MRKCSILVAAFLAACCMDSFSQGVPWWLITKPPTTGFVRVESHYATNSTTSVVRLWGPGVTNMTVAGFTTTVYFAWDYNVASNWVNVFAPGLSNAALYASNAIVGMDTNAWNAATNISSLSITGTPSVVQSTSNAIGRVDDHNLQFVLNTNYLTVPTTYAIVTGGSTVNQDVFGTYHSIPQYGTATESFTNISGGIGMLNHESGHWSVWVSHSYEWINSDDNPSGVYNPWGGSSIGIVTVQMYRAVIDLSNVWVNAKFTSSVPILINGNPVLTNEPLYIATSNQYVTTNSWTPTNAPVDDVGYVLSNGVWSAQLVSSGSGGLQNGFTNDINGTSYTNTGFKLYPSTNMFLFQEGGTQFVAAASGGGASLPTWATNNFGVTWVSQTELVFSVVSPDGVNTMQLNHIIVEP